MLGGVAQSAARAAERLTVRSALNPMLWLVAIATPACFVAAYAFREHGPLLGVLIVAALTPIALTCAGFAYFAIVKPEKLQSEDYQLRHETLQIIQQKTGTVVLDPASLTAIANPALPLLPEVGEGGKQ